MADPNIDPLAALAAEADAVIDATTIGLLMEAEYDPTIPNAPVEVGPLMAYLLVAACQLTCTHPQIGPQLGALYEEMGRTLQGLFGGPAFDMLERGWDRSHDRPTPNKEQ